MIDLTGGPCIYKRISGCGSGTEYMAVTPWGDLYPCHQFVGEEAYKLGDIWNGVTNTALREEFRSCNAYARPECNDCWARSLLLRRLRSQRLSTPPALSAAFTRQAANCSASVLNVPS